MFDIKKLNKSSFRGVPFFTKDDSASGGQRLTDHKFINGGTKTESNGIDNDTFRISGYLVGDDYLNIKNNLIYALKNIEPGILIDKFYGEQFVFVESWSINESISRIGVADIDISFKLAENEITIEPFFLFTRDIRTEIFAYFEKEFILGMGEYVNREIIKKTTNFLQSIGSIVNFLNYGTNESQAIKSSIATTIYNFDNGPLSSAILTNDINEIFIGFDNLLDLGLSSVNDQKTATNMLRTLSENAHNATYDNEIERLENIQTNLYVQMTVGGLIQSYIKNLDNIYFTTGDDFGSVKDDVLTIYKILEQSVTNSETIADNISISHDLIDAIHKSKREFIQYYTELFSGLQNLENEKIVASIDVLNLTMEKYGDIGRYEEVLINNNIVDPFFINGEVRLLPL